MTRVMAKTQGVTFGNTARYTYALLFMNLLRTTRSNAFMLTAQVKRQLASVHTSSRHIKELEANIEWAKDRPSIQRSCKSVGKDIQCPFLSDQSVCTNGDYNASPVSIAIALTAGPMQDVGRPELDIRYDNIIDDDDEGGLPNTKRPRTGTA